MHECCPQSKTSLGNRPWLLSVLTLLVLAGYGLLRSALPQWCNGWLLPVLFLLGAYAVRREEMFEFRFNRRTLQSVLQALLLYIILLPLIGVVWWWLHEHYFHRAGNWIGGRELVEVLAWQLAGAALVEEIWFRGVLQHSFAVRARRKKTFFGISCFMGMIWASGVFALSHVLVFQNLWGMLRFVPGLVFACFYSKEKGLLSPVLLHFLFNISLMIWK